MAMELLSPSRQMVPLVLLLGLLAGSPSTALPRMDRVRWQVDIDSANRRGLSIGLVMSYVAEDTALQASGCFRPWPVQPFVDLYGRRFLIGSIQGVNVIYSLSLQTLLDVFSVSGIVHYGTAGSCNDSVSFGDVSISKLLVSLWKKFFWIPVDSAWFKIAGLKLRDTYVNLEKCNGTFWLPKTPQVVHGLKATSADMFLHNAEYRKFLLRTFGVSTTDEESAAAVMVSSIATFSYFLLKNQPAFPLQHVGSITNTIKISLIKRNFYFGRQQRHLVCLSLCSVEYLIWLEGGPPWSSASLMNLASINALKVAVEFIATIGRQKSTSSVQSSNK
ncbi:hypothetical protein VPH35_068719 [Triticum aestivum]